MGYTKAAFQWLVDVYKLGLFKGLDSVLELGSQVIERQVGKKYFLEYSRLIDKDIKIDSLEYSLKSFYSIMGFKTYNSIDTDGRLDSYAFDLNKLIAEEYNFTKTFDLVTNMGTTEHVFNQSASFENVHNLTSTNGLMIHWVPVYGWINHGFYQISPIIFEDLAFENKYNVLKRQLIIREDGISKEKIIDIDDINVALRSRTLFQQSVKSGITMVYICILEKQTNEKFKTPFQGLYRQTNTVQGYKQREENSPTIAEDYFQKASKLQKEGQLLRAIAAYRQAIQMDSEKADYYYGLGEALVEVNKLDEAIKSYHQSIQLDPNWFRSYFDLGVALEKTNKMQDAIAMYQKAVELHPGFAWSYYRLGNILNELGFTKESSSYYKKAVKVHPPDKSFIFYQKLGQTLMQLEELEEAKLMYYEAIEIHPNSYEFYWNLGKVLENQGQIEKATANYQKAAKLNPDIGKT